MIFLNLRILFNKILYLTTAIGKFSDKSLSWYKGFEITVSGSKLEFKTSDYGLT